MKKVLFTAVALIMAISFVSCEKDEEKCIVCSAVSNVEYYIDASDATISRIKEIDNLIDIRLNEVLGKTFKLAYDEKTMRPTNKALESCANKIEKDSKMKEYVRQLSELKTESGTNAVSALYIYFMTGNTEVGVYELTFE